MTRADELWHAAFISLHALAAVVALVSGIVTLHTGRGFVLHRIGIVVMAAGLGPSFVFGWPGFSPVARMMFSGLAVLAVFMVVQVFRAGHVRARELRSIDPDPEEHRPLIGPRFVEVLGFNVIALTVAGTVVPVLRVGGGTLGVVISVVVSVAIGHVLVERRKSQVAPLTSAEN